MKTRIGVILLVLYASLTGSCTADEVFFGNLHSHTSYSDGVSTPDVAYAHARDIAHVDFLAITEHNHLTGATRIGSHPELYSGAIPTSLISTAGRFNNDGHFVAIYGQEFSSIESGNHANVFEVGDVIRSADVPSGRWDTLFNTWLPTHLDSTGQPAIMLLNHPATSDSPNSVEYGIDDFANLGTWLAALDKHVSLINIINGPSHAGETDAARPSESEFLRYLAMGLHVAPTADQDNHQPNWGDAAKPRTAIIVSSLTKANILTAMRSRHVYATQDPNLKIIATVNGKLMGTRFQGADVPAPNATLNISVQISDADEPAALYTIDVYQDTLGDTHVADVVKQLHVQGDGTFAVPDVKYAGGNQYLFLKISQTDDDHVLVDHAWLAPVWFEPSAVTPGTPATPPATTVLTLDVDVIAEKAVIANVGTTTINLKDWTVVSVVGDQRFKFPSDLMLMPGKSVTVTSGPTAVDAPPEFVRWSTSPKWSNSGDPGRLLSPDGTEMAKTD